MNKTLKDLKEVIQKANPEIMELKFGCQFTENPSHGQIYTASWETIGGNWVAAEDAEEYDSTEISILGRPIRLADVLLALGESPEVAPSYEGEEFPAMHKVARIVYLWRLADDNLDHQSKECHEFLINLLT